MTAGHIRRGLVHVAAAFGARIPGLPMMVPEKLGDRFEYRGGRISRSGS